MLLICSTQLYNKLNFSVLWTIFCQYILFIHSLYSDDSVSICLGLLQCGIDFRFLVWLIYFRLSKKQKKKRKQQQKMNSMLDMVSVVVFFPNCSRHTADKYIFHGVQFVAIPSELYSSCFDL